MISRFINSFRRNDGDELRAFQAKVLAMLRQIRPDKTFSLTDDPRTIQCGDGTLGLTNLRANYLLTRQTDADLMELIVEGLALAVDAMADKDIDWNKAKDLLMPQLMPREYLSKMELVSKPFGDTVVIGYVLDSEKTYSYVTDRDFDGWEVDLEHLHATALQNLDTRSRGLEATVIDGPNGVIAVDTLDGFDASRILLSDLRERFAEILGVKDFYFGVPNRDFLICWSANDDETFQASMRAQVEADSESRAYPLSGRTFVALSDGTLDVFECETERDPRADVAAEN